MASETLLAAGVEPVPFAYTVPPAGELELLAVSTKYDGSGAAGDYVPTLIVRNPAGIIQYEVPIGETVAAGDDARVTWAPFLRGKASPIVITSGLLWGRAQGQIIPSGVVTNVTLSMFTSAPGSERPFLLNNLFQIVQPLQVVGTRVWVQVAVTWPAGAYDRYVEFAPPGITEQTGEIVVRARGAVTPSDDIQVVEAIVTGDPAAPVLLNMRCFQASGVNKTINAQFVAYGWPAILGQGYG